MIEILLKSMPAMPGQRCWWQALEGWLLAPASAEELRVQQALQAQLAADQAQLVDVFD